MALAVAQMGVHLVFFLHLTTGPDNTNNALALAFGVLIVTLVIGGSLWIMANLNHNMLPMARIMEMRNAEFCGRPVGRLRAQRSSGPAIVTYAEHVSRPVLRATEASRSDERRKWVSTTGAGEEGLPFASLMLAATACA